MKIAIDAMGGDQAPKAPVLGVLKASEIFPENTYFLFGKEAAIRAEVPETLPDNVHIVPCQDVILTGDAPVMAVRKKKDASMNRALQAVKKGDCQAMISAGNSGALMFAGLLQVKALKGIDRPVFLANVPSLNNPKKQFIVIDAGANVDSKPKQLFENAVMGNYYYQSIYGESKPRIGLLNNGKEAQKGTQLTKTVYEWLDREPSLNFIGNVEPDEVLNDVCDVLVADGFNANMVVKAVEGTAKTFLNVFKDLAATGGIREKLGGLLLKPALKEKMRLLDPNRAGAGLVFGLRAPVLKCHGSANEEAFTQAIKLALKMDEVKLYEDLAEAFSQLNIPGNKSSGQIIELTKNTIGDDKSEARNLENDRAILEKKSATVDESTAIKAASERSKDKFKAVSEDHFENKLMEVENVIAERESDQAEDVKGEKGE